MPAAGSAMEVEIEAPSPRGPKDLTSMSTFVRARCGESNHTTSCETRPQHGGQSPEWSSADNHHMVLPRHPRDHARLVHAHPFWCL